MLRSGYRICRPALTLGLALSVAGVHARPIDPSLSSAPDPPAVDPLSIVELEPSTTAGEADNTDRRTQDGSGPPVASLRLNALLSELLARNPEIAAREAVREAEKVRERRARALPDPIVQIMAENIPFSSGAMDSPSAVAGATGTLELPPMITYQVSQMFMFPGKRRLMAREAAASVEVARARLELTRQELLAAARRMFFDLYLNLQARRINRANQQLAEQFLRLALARYSAGLEAHHDVLRAMVELQSFENELLTLEQQRQSMTAMINAWLEQPVETPIGEPAATFAPARKLEQTALEAQAIKARPELQRMAAMVAQEEAMAALARRAYYPDIMVMGSYQQMFGEMDAWGAAISVSIPVWLRKKQALEVRERQYRAEAARKSLEAMRAMVRFQVEDARLKVETAERRIRLLEETLIPRAEDALKSSMASYAAGKTGFVDLLESRRTLQELQLGREQARVEREQRLADLDRAIGRPQEEIRR